MIAEYDDPSYAAITPDMRKWFYENKRPLTDWKIWVGYYEGSEWKKRYRHTGFSVMEHSEFNKLGAIIPNKCNSQSSTFVAGHLFMQVISTSFDPLKTWKHQDSAGIFLHQIFPNRESVIVWPTIFSIDDNWAMLISDMFWESTFPASVPHPIPSRTLGVTVQR